MKFNLFKNAPAQQIQAIQIILCSHFLIMKFFKCTHRY
jgi:hypothetical protein